MKSSILISILMPLFLFQAFLKAQTTFTLTISNNNWDAAGTWTPQGIPGPGDFVVIDNKSVIIEGSNTIAGFTIIDGNINFEGTDPTLTITDTSIWYDGELDGGNGANGGNTVNSNFIIAPGAILILDTDATPESHRFYEGITITNRGTIRHIGSSNLGIRGLSVLKNEGLYDVISDADFTGESFSGGTFLNTSTGIFRKSGGTEVTSFNTWWNFQNQGGTIDAHSGSIHFIGLGTFDGANFIAGNNAAIDFKSSTQIFKGAISGSPAGTVRLSGSTINIDSSGVTLDFQGTGFQFSKGSLRGGGTLTIPVGSLLRLVPDPVDPTSNLSLQNGTTILNLGTIRQESNTTFGANGNSVIDNRSLFEIASDADFSGGTGSGGTFINTGTFRKSGGTDVTSFNTWWNFQNQGGTIDAQSGSIHFTGLGTFDGGNFIAANNASIDFRSSTQIFKGAISGSPSGIVRLSGSTINIDSSGVTLDFQGTGFQFSKGSLRGGGTLTIPAGSLLRLVPDPVDPTSNLSLQNGTTILNLGTIRQESNTTFGANGNSVIDNRSLFEIVTDADFSGGTGSGGTFINTGTFRKSGGNDITQMNTWWKFFNQSGGVIDAASGELEFSMSNINFENSEGAIIMGTDTIDVPGAFTNNGVIAPGSSVGVLTYVGNFVPSSTGVLDIELGGLTAGSEHDQLNITGNAGLDGTLKIYLSGSFIPAAGDSFVVLTATGTVADSFQTIEAQSGLYLTVKRNSNNVTILVDSVGTIVSAEDHQNGELITSYDLSQNYPNPFNPSTVIQFAIPQSSYITLEIFNVLGESIGVILSETLNAGKHYYKWNAGGLPSGIYLYQVTASPSVGAGRDFKAVRKMILIK